MRRLCYIAAPYSDDDLLIVEWNVKRACALAKLVALQGHAPICVHPGIQAIYGEETEANRALGMSVDLTIVHEIASSVGSICALTYDDGKLAPGVREEVATFRSASIYGLVSLSSWLDLRPGFVKNGLLNLWESLKKRPAAPPIKDTPYRAIYKGGEVLDIKRGAVVTVLYIYRKRGVAKIAFAPSNQNDIDGEGIWEVNLSSLS